MFVYNITNYIINIAIYTYKMYSYKQTSYLHSCLKYMQSCFQGLDIFLLLILLSLLLISSFTIYSASIGTHVTMFMHMRNVLIFITIVFCISQISPNIIMRFATPVYIIGIILLLAVMFAGISKKGSQRWLNIGITILQPSELLKIATPLMLAYYYHHKDNAMKIKDYFIGAIILLIPFLLIAKQPDLGTAILVFSSGLYVIFLSGFSWKIIIALFSLMLISLGTILIFENQLCAQHFSWQPFLHDYQKYRICTLLNPAADPLGKGFHVLQSSIAIGSGGWLGKGWLNGMQSQLEFVPEKHTDFIFAVYAEEFGLIGNIVLLSIYTLLILRSFWIASTAQMRFCKLIAGTIGLMIFTYVFVNIGMVSGVLPVVGVPLPLMSYGGTAFATIGVCIGILMSIKKHATKI
jgi:rod shape determining protein RodA